MKFSNIVKDPAGYLFFMLRNVKGELSAFLITQLVKLSLFLKGIPVGRSCKFIGLPLIVRHPLSIIKIDDECVIRSDFSSNLIGINHKCVIATLYKKAEIIIGKGSSMSGTTIAAATKVQIGKNVLCGGNVLITDYDWHLTNPRARRNSLAKSKPVYIDDNVWLGVNAVVLKGVTIGQNSVIGANSLVLKDIPSNVVAGGNPCKVLYEIKQD